MAKCVTCLSPKAKDLLVAAFPPLRQQIMAVATCSDGLPFRFCSRSGRGRSEYQEFVSKCLQEKKVKSFAGAPQAMRECAALWRGRRKG